MVASGQSVYRLMLPDHLCAHGSSDSWLIREHLMLAAI